MARLRSTKTLLSSKRLRLRHLMMAFSEVDYSELEAKSLSLSTTGKLLASSEESISHKISSTSFGMRTGLELLLLLKTLSTCWSTTNRQWIKPLPRVKERKTKMASKKPFNSLTSMQRQSTQECGYRILASLSSTSGEA